MSIKDLLVHVDRSPASARRLDWALGLAARFSARVSGLALVAEPFIPALVGVHIPAELLQRQVAEAEGEMEAVLETARQAGQRHGIAIAASRVTAPLDRLPAVLARAARHVDLCVLGQPDAQDADLDTTALAEAAFMASGRPAVIVPHTGTPSTAVRRVLIAWNGSREATRAVHDALPLLAAAAHSTLLVVDPAHQVELNDGTPGAEIAAHLARHGVKVEVKSTPGGGLPIGDVLLSQAAEEGADLLVMGGYGHSRLRETVLGGATRQLLAQMTLPVLLSH
jgi:nucleotide-binding universal stress UspA family protein